MSSRHLGSYHLPFASSHQRMKRYLNRRRSLLLEHLSHSDITPGLAVPLAHPHIRLQPVAESQQSPKDPTSIWDSIDHLPSELKSTKSLLIFKGDLDYQNFGRHCHAFLFSDVLILATDVRPKPRGSLIPALRRRLSVFFPNPHQQHLSLTFFTFGSTRLPYSTATLKTCSLLKNRLESHVISFSRMTLNG